MFKQISLFVFCIFMFLFQSSLIAEYVYEVIDLQESMKEYNIRSSYAWSINNKSQVVGYCVDYNGSRRAFLWDYDSQSVYLFSPTGAEALSINDLSQVMINAGNKRIYIWDKDILSNIEFADYYAEEAYGINNSGRFVGQVRDGKESGYYWDSETGINILSDNGNAVFRARAINDKCQIVGMNKNGHAFIHDPNGAFTDLGTLDDINSDAFDINMCGQVVGVSYTPKTLSYKAFVWDKYTGMIDLNSVVEEVSYGRGINIWGQVVGFGVNTTGQYHGCLWTPSKGMVDLNTMLGSACPYKIVKVEKINRKSQIAGSIVGSNGFEHAILLNPVHTTNHAPVANAGADLTVYTNSEDPVGVQLDAKESSDEDNDDLLYLWNWNEKGEFEYNNKKTVFVYFPYGEHVVSLTVFDGVNESIPDEIIVTVTGPYEEELFVCPSKIKHKGKEKYILGRLSIPEGICVKDIESVKIFPGNIAAEKWCCNGKSSMLHLFAIFDLQKVLNSIGHDDYVKLTVVVKLYSGKYVFGNDYISIIRDHKDCHSKVCDITNRNK